MQPPPCLFCIRLDIYMLTKSLTSMGTGHGSYSPIAHYWFHDDYRIYWWYIAEAVDKLPQISLTVIFTAFGHTSCVFGDCCLLVAFCTFLLYILHAYFKCQKSKLHVIITYKIPHIFWVDQVYFQ